MYILLMILFAGLVLKGFYTHFFSKTRRYFSFDERRYTQDEDNLLKLQSLNIRDLERIFLILMAITHILAVFLYGIGSGELSVWVLATVLVWQLLLSSIIDFRLYKAFYDRAHLVMAVIWIIAIVLVYVGITRMDIL